MPGIFINYRRDDAPGVAGRLYDHLAKSFSRRDLFIDVDAIKPGLDFVKQLDAEVSQCDVVLALIGPHWLDAVDEQGRQRLYGDKDYVRIEIASALKRDIPVIPVLVHGAAMPAEDQLPEDLKSLSRRQALELRHTRFAADAEAIVSALKDTLPRRKKTWLLVAAAACGVVALGVGIALYAWRGQTPVPSTATAPPPYRETTQTPTFQTEQRDASGRIITEAAKIHTFACQGGGAIYVYEYVNRPGFFRAIQPPNWGRALGGRDFRSFADAAGAGCASVSLQAEAPQAPAPAARPMPSIEGVTVALGDPRSSVRQAYPAAIETPAGDLAMPLDGIKFFFTEDDQVLREIMVEAPFKGGVDGIKIGDTADDVVARRGQPYAIAEVYGGSGYLYSAGGNILRYDVDGKSKKVTDIVQMLNR